MNHMSLSDFIGSVPSFTIKNPAAWIVGPMALNGKASYVDVMLNLHPSESDSSMACCIRQHLQKSLPSSIASRIRWLYNDGSGPSASYVPLFSLVSNPIVSNVQLNSASSIKPLHFFRQLKAQQGRLRRDVFKIESLQEIIPSSSYPVEVNMKYDGIRSQIHSDGNRVLILTDDGGDITSRFPSIVSEMKLHNMPMVLDVEITGSVNGIHIGRSDVAGYSNSKSSPDDSSYTAYAHDLLYKDSDIHNLSRVERMKMLSIHGSIGNKIKVIPFRIANNKDELKAHVSYFSSVPGSEGAMIKSLDSAYELDGLSSRWWKFKKDFMMNAKVLKVFRYGSSFNYLCVIDDGVPIGQTYNTSLQADVGDIIQVAFGNLNRYTDGDRVWYNWVFPRVIGIQESLSEPDTISHADFFNAESSGSNEERRFPSRYVELSESSIKLLSNSKLLEKHYELHALFEASNEKQNLSKLHNSVAAEMLLRNIFHNTPMVLSGKDLDMLSEYRKFMKAPIDDSLFEAFDEFIVSNRKLKYSYSENNLSFADVSYVLLKPSFPTRAIPNAHIQLSNATGLYESGIQKPHFMEFFMNGNLDGVFHLMKIPQSGNFFDAGSVPFEWRLDKVQCPYILSDDAVRKMDFLIGSDSVSFLPYELECKVPKELQWWGIDISMNEAVARLSNVRDLFVSLDLLSRKSLTRSAPLRYERTQGLYDIQVEHIVSLSDPSLRLSRSEIASAVGCGISTVYSWQKKYELL